MKKTLLIFCTILLLSGCSFTQKQPSDAVEPQGTPNPKIAAPADISYPNSPSIEDYDARIAIDDNNPVDSSLLDGYTSFSQESFSAILRDVKGNVSYSPMSLYYPMMLTLQASEGTTAKQLQTLLHVKTNNNADHMGNLYRRLYTDNEGGQLKIANSLWIQKDFPVKKDFIRTANKQYYASLHTVDFSQTKTADLMAAWIREHTNGELSPSIQTDESMRSAILNAIYYKARFDQEFEKKDTRQAVFHTADKDVTADFMHKEMDSHSFIDNDRYASTSLPLSNSSTLTLVLPKEEQGAGKLLESKGFIQELFQDDASGSEFGIVKLSLPKFRVHSKLQLRDAIKAMGVSSLFDTTAELDGISDAKPLFVSRIQQETSIDLNEEGVEASAYTMIAADGAANVEHPKLLDLNLNREFLYIISTNMDGKNLLLFIGICADPTRKE
ncbi:serpin family protein [Erysipelotrichaceae bacterium AF15-26LB]|nr:serpin family protein [[Clostridium] innocuum]RJV86486.1 serpin family protein [Erysipelotrichaceae bacterium AF15-26LB]RJV89592.1 serpin family protein [Erysipelotrichaceae bacterium AF19-24AC]